VRAGRRAGDYDPTTGTFLTRDPLDAIDGTPTVANPYHYVDNDPLNKTDPLGLRPCDRNLSTLEGADDQTADTKAIAAFLSRSDNGKACLESVDVDGRGRAVLTIGDPDRAPNVLVMPAAAGQDLRDGFLATVVGVNALRNLAGPDLAVVAYLGYDTPNGFAAGVFGFDGLQPDEARALAGRVNMYVGRHVTALGYSYGAQAMAQALMHGGRVNDLVLLGPFFSSSVSIGGADRVWVGANHDDSYTAMAPGLAKAHGFRAISTAGTSGHDYLPLDADQNLRGDAAQNVARIARGRFGDVICDAVDPDCWRV